jgi:hypothetical protein
MNCWEFIITNLQSSGLSDPGQRALDDPADFAQPAAMERSRLGQVILNPSLPQAPAVARRAIRSVSVQAFRPAASATARLSDHWYVVEERQRLKRVVTLRACDTHRQGNALSVYEQMAFRAFFGPIGRVFAGEYPPKTARKLWLSTTAFDQSSSPSRPRRSRRTCSSFFQTPRRCQSRSRRQHVTPEPQPISWGNIHQGIPLWRTKMMPVRQARSSTGGRPRFPGPALCAGRSGSTVSHNSSGTKGRAMIHLHAGNIRPTSLYRPTYF